jgi:hypothetical protein
LCCKRDKADNVLFDSAIKGTYFPATNIVDWSPIRFTTLVSPFYGDPTEAFFILVQQCRSIIVITKGLQTWGSQYFVRERKGCSSLEGNKRFSAAVLINVNRYAAAGR